MEQLLSYGRVDFAGRKTLVGLSESAHYGVSGTQYTNNFWVGVYSMYINAKESPL